MRSIFVYCFNTSLLTSLSFLQITIRLEPGTRLTARKARGQMVADVKFSMKLLFLSGNIESVINSGEFIPYCCIKKIKDKLSPR